MWTSLFSTRSPGGRRAGSAGGGVGATLLHAAGFAGSEGASGASSKAKALRGPVLRRRRVGLRGPALRRSGSPFAMYQDLCWSVLRGASSLPGVRGGRPAGARLQQKVADGDQARRRRAPVGQGRHPQPAALLRARRARARGRGGGSEERGSAPPSMPSRAGAARPAEPRRRLAALVRGPAPLGESGPSRCRRPAAPLPRCPVAHPRRARGAGTRRGHVESARRRRQEGARGEREAPAPGGGPWRDRGA